MAADSTASSPPSSYPSAPEEYQAIIAKYIQQSQVDDSDKLNMENAKLRNK